MKIGVRITGNCERDTEYRSREPVLVAGTVQVEETITLENARLERQREGDR